MKRRETILRNEVGAAVALMAPVTVAMLAVSALCVDAYIMSTTQEQLRHSCEYASLSALERYLELENQPYNVRLSSALQTANTVAGMNQLLGSPDVQLSQLSLNSGAQGQGVLTAGRWCFKQSAGQGSPCAMPPGQPFVPHFRTNVSNPAHVNAFRCEANAFPPLRTHFARAIGQESVAIRASATASFIPRRVKLTVDATGSVSYMTHLPSGTHRARYAYRLPLSGTDQTMWNQLSNTRPGPGVSTRHYKSDYETITVAGVSYKIDTYRHIPTDTGNPNWAYNPQYNYGGPEPLTSILKGVHGALEEFEHQAVPGDQVGLLAFDNEIIPLRQIPLGGDPAHIQRLLKITDTVTDVNLSDPNRDRDNLYDAFLWPRPGYTDIHLALDASLDELENSSTNDGATRDSVVLLTDGLTNCRSFQNCSNTFSYYGPAVTRVQNLVPQFRSGRIQLHIILAGGSVGPHTLNIRSERHIDWANCMATHGNQSACGAEPSYWMSDTEARRLGRMFVNRQCGGSACDSSDFSIMSSTDPFFDPNGVFYSIARETQALWGPLRPIDPATGVGQPAVRIVGERQLYDPEGLTIEEQAYAHVKQVMGRNPFLLTE